jgi:hypothetical protein
MLKIMTYDNGHRTVLELDGKLVGPWVNELERVWHQAERARAVHVVLKEVGCIDENGKELLARISRSGASLVAVGCLTKAVLHDVLKKGSAGSHEGYELLSINFTEDPKARKNDSETEKSIAV